jgi:RNA polymerase sigma factor (sigma-70 family)
MLASLVSALPSAERQALAYRFFGNWTQVQIAEILGVSQMQVSRLAKQRLPEATKSRLRQAGSGVRAVVR